MNTTPTGGYLIRMWDPAGRRLGPQAFKHRHDALRFMGLLLWAGYHAQFIVVRHLAEDIQPPRAA